MSGGVESRGIRVMCSTWQLVLEQELKWQSECWLLVKEKRAVSQESQAQTEKDMWNKGGGQHAFGEFESKTQLGLR